MKTKRVIYEIGNYKVIWYLDMREISVFHNDLHRATYCVEFDEYVESSVENAEAILDKYLKKL